MENLFKISAMLRAGVLILMSLPAYAQIQVPTDPTPTVPTDPPPVTVLKDCTFNEKIIKSGKFVTAYQNSTVAYGENCVSEQRKCVDGVFVDGSYNYSQCAVGQPADCRFNNMTISNGASVTAFTTSSVNYGTSCSTVAETRICTNGELSGQANYASCDVGAPKACLFNGATLAHGESAIGYASSTVQYGESCVAEERVCNNGVLSGINLFGSCTVNQPSSCLWNGLTIAHGEVVTAYASASVQVGQTCTSQVRSCQNGILTGEGEFASCVVDVSVAPEIYNLYWEFPTDCGCNSGQGYNNSLYSTDGGKKWTRLVAKKPPTELLEVWNYMIKKYGSNKCKRPNVKYVSAWHRGYVKFDKPYIPNSSICRFVEISADNGNDINVHHHHKHNHHGLHKGWLHQNHHQENNRDDDKHENNSKSYSQGQCQKQKKPGKPKVEIKFICEDKT